LAQHAALGGAGLHANAEVDAFTMLIQQHGGRGYTVTASLPRTCRNPRCGRSRSLS
jgi:hypothetical protein